MIKTYRWLEPRGRPFGGIATAEMQQADAGNH